MCCFSQPIESVTNTAIFARTAPNGTQYLAYQMHLRADRDLAMILPLPVDQRLGERAVQFISLKGYPEFFDEMATGFPAKNHSINPFAAKATRSTLPVESVGNFEASFVPGVADFNRLDERYRLPTGVWENLPAYARYGFAVFKIKSGAETIHPMAFSFQPENARLTFFPTVHIHDGSIHEKAEFDHQLYLQTGRPVGMTPLGAESLWQESPRIPVQFMKAGRSNGIVDPGRHIHRLTLNGTYRNRDILVTTAV